MINDDIDLQEVSLKEFKVKPCTIQDIRPFTESWHYSNNVNGLNVTQCFSLNYQNKIIGAIVYGRLGMANVWKKYTKDITELVELKRLCCINKTPKNTESYFISKTIKWLKQNTNINKIISYADPYYDHEGIVYQASNFEYLGTTAPCKHIKFNDRLYHEKSIRNKYKGKLKPYAQRLRDALERGDAIYIKTPGKHIYLYDLIRTKKEIKRGIIL